jgi:hypothetical protein
MVRTRVLYVLVAVLWLAAFAFFVHFASSHVFKLAADSDDNGSGGNVAAGALRKETIDSVVQLQQKQQQQKEQQQQVQSPRGNADNEFASDSLAWNATIFVNMAAYRDKLCHRTVWEAIARAANPSRLYFGIYQQHNESSDPDCLSFETLCPLLNDPSPAVFAPGSNEYAGTRADVARACAVLPRIRINRIDYLKAEGPTVGRFVAQEMMDDQHFYLQIDTHSLFVGGWDVELIVTWQMANDANAVFTTYPRDAHLMPQWQKLMPSARTRDIASGFTVRSVDVVRNTSLYPYDPNIIYFPPTVPVVCSGKFLGDDMGRMAKFNAHAMLVNKLRPVMAPYFAAGFAFMPARAVRICRYDVHTPMLFDGEELSYAARLFTHGFNLYAPPTDTVYHKYETGENPKYWQVDWNARYYVQLRSSRRIAAVLSGTEPPPSALLDYDVKEFQRFGLGKVRTIEQYMAYSSVDIPNKSFRSVCDDIDAGRFGSNVQRVPLRP